MNVIKILDSIFAASALIIAEIYIFTKYLERTINYKKLYNIIIHLLYGALIIGNNLLGNYSIRIILNFFITAIFVKLLYRTQFKEASILSFIVALVSLLAEIAIFIIIFILQIDADFIVKIAGSALSNTIIAIAMLVITDLTFKFGNKFFIWYCNNERKQTIIFILMYSLAIGFILTNMSENLEVNNQMITNFALILIFMSITLTMFSEKRDKGVIGETYNKLLSSAKYTEDLLDQQYVDAHENKNQLSIIRGLANENNKELIDYLDKVTVSTPNNEWIPNLQYIPSGGLKGLISQKVSEAKRKNINVFCHISKDIQKMKDIKLKDYTEIYKIIGVFLDNAIEAAEQIENSEMLVEIYFEEDKIIFSVSNTINEEMYKFLHSNDISSKGMGRGHGLRLVSQIISSNELLSLEREISHNVCSFSLIIKLK